MKFDLSKGHIPLMTSRSSYFKGIVTELLWIMGGSTDVNELKKVGNNTWNGNSSREFLDKSGLKHYAVGDIGPAYGFQLRHFGAEYKGCTADYKGKGLDQLQTLA